MTEKITFINSFMDQLSNFEFTEKFFINVLGLRMGKHVYFKFIQYNGEILDLWCYLDSTNKDKIARFFVTRSE